MNTRKVYACYRKDCPTEDYNIEFWSANKKLYDMFLSTYKMHMDASKSEYIQTILPIEQYETLYDQNRMDMLDIFQTPPWYSSSSEYHISTLNYEEIFDVDEFLEQFIDIEHDYFDMINILPTHIRNIIYRTRWADILSKPNETLCSSILDINYDKIRYLIQSCYYGSSFEDITGI